MTEAQIADILARLRVDLGIKGTTAYDERLVQIIKSSYESIVLEGASTLDASDESDIQLIVMYAAWQWNNRRTGEKMNPMVRWHLNNRIFSEKAKTNG